MKLRKCLGFRAFCLRLAQHLGFSDSPGLIDWVKFGSAWKFWGDGEGGECLEKFASATAILTCTSKL